MLWLLDLAFVLTLLAGAAAALYLGLDEGVLFQIITWPCGLALFLPVYLGIHDGWLMAGLNLIVATLGLIRIWDFMQENGLMGRDGLKQTAGFDGMTYERL